MSETPALRNVKIIAECRADNLGLDAEELETTGEQLGGRPPDKCFNSHRRTTRAGYAMNADDNVGSANVPRQEAGATGSRLPAVVDRAAYQAERDALLAGEKAHTRAGDELAAGRRRLPMVEVDASIRLIGPDGPITLLDAFEGRRQLIAYYHMWYPGKPTAEQCEGCSVYNGQVRELSYLHSRDVTYATFCYGPHKESLRYRDFMGWDVPWYSAQDSADPLLAGRPFNRFMLVCYLRDGHRVFETYWTTGRGVEPMAPGYAGLLDLTVYGRQETWEDSPAGWPQRWGDNTAEPNPYRTNGRPISQWSRLQAGRSDERDNTGR